MCSNKLMIQSESQIINAVSSPYDDRYFKNHTLVKCLNNLFSELKYFSFLKFLIKQQII